MTLSPRHHPRSQQRLREGQHGLLRQDRDGKGMLVLMGCIPLHKGPPICLIIKIQLVSYGEQMQPSQDPGKALVAPDPRVPCQPRECLVSRPPSRLCTGANWCRGPGSQASHLVSTAISSLYPPDCSCAYFTPIQLSSEL